MFSLELPHRGNTNEYAQYTISNIKRKSLEFIPNIIMSAAMGIVLGHKNEFEIVVVTEQQYSSH